MEREYYHSKVGNALEARDIVRMTRTLFEPAIDRCEIDITGVGEPVYYKEDDAGFHDEDGMDYHHSFYSTVNDRTGLRQYGVYEEATQKMTLDQLTFDECNRVRLQFQQKHVAAGGQITDLSNNLMWKALYDPEIYTGITLCVASTRSFVFAGTRAVKSFAIERRLCVEGDVIILDAYHLDDEVNDAAGAFTDQWEPEQVAMLDMAGEDVFAVTTKDREEIISILDELSLLSYNDQNGLLREA